MPLLGIGKKTEAEAPKEEVPEELPDLPQTGDAPAEAGAAGAEAAPQEGAEGAAAPDELPPLDPSASPASPGDLAPDELPPVEGGAIPSPGDEVAPGADDRRLYFASMLQKLHEEGVKSTKLTSPSVNLLTDMKKHYKQVKKEEAKTAMQQELADSLTPLQKLEQEWVTLQEDIEQKKKMLHEKEAEIRKLAEDAKSLAAKAEKMNKN